MIFWRWPLVRFSVRLLAICASVRALTLSALAPQPGQHLWDIGGGSGSIAIEWLLSDPTTQATSIEPRPDRAARIRANADRLGVDRLAVVTGGAPDALAGLPDPQAVFVGGGLSAALLDVLMDRLGVGTRLVANAVTLESEALLSTAQARWGGDLLRIELAQAAPLGRGPLQRTKNWIVLWQPGRMVRRSGWRCQRSSSPFHKAAKPM